MRGKSHRHLGIFLAEKYMPHTPKRYIRAFLIGCVQPDRNPATYLKGSVRRQWLRGHNWENAQRYINKLSERLEMRSRLRLLDYYAIGKLIHYTVDAFTSAHNEHFGTSLQNHRQYEIALQHHFLEYLSRCPEIRTDSVHPIMVTIREYHRDYLRRPISIHTDTRFSIIVCSMVLTRLFSHP